MRSTPPRTRRAVAVVVLAAFGAFSGTGCLSHQHRIPREELARLARLAPAERGRAVRVIQELGERRGSQLPPSHAAEPYGDAGFQTEVMVQLDPFGHHGRGHSPGPAVSSGNPGGGPVRVAPAVGAAPAPTGPVPARAIPRSGGGAGLSSIKTPAPSGKAEDLVVLAIVVMAIAVMAAAGVAVTEGMRYDGQAEIEPGQLLYLEGAGGQQKTVALAELTEADAAYARQALVMDDEGWGLRLLGRRPLDRHGFAFKVDLGASDLRFDEYRVWGLASHLQLGFFPHQRIGVLAGVTFAGGNDEGGSTVVRHTVGLELQAFPLRLGRLHLGAYGQGGLATAAGPALTGQGPAFGTGGLLELALTTRLALTARAGWSTARLHDHGWSSALVLTAGVAIY